MGAHPAGASHDEWTPEGEYEGWWTGPLRKQD
jgi:hypothetical protein